MRNLIVILIFVLGAELNAEMSADKFKEYQEAMSTLSSVQMRALAAKIRESLNDIPKPPLPMEIDKIMNLPKDATVRQLNNAVVVFSPGKRPRSDVATPILEDAPAPKKMCAGIAKKIDFGKDQKMEIEPKV